MTTPILKILTISSILISTTTYATTIKELDKSSPKIATSASKPVVVKQKVENKKQKALVKHIDKASTKSKNPIHKPQSSKAVNPMFQSSRAKNITLPKDKTSGKPTGKRVHEKGSGLPTGRRKHEKGNGKATGIRKHKPEGE